MQSPENPLALADVQQFRLAVRSWFTQNAAEFGNSDGRSAAKLSVPQRREWSRRLWAAGLVGLTWPRAFGGQGLSPEHQAVFVEEQALAGAPPHLGIIGMGIIGPTLIVHGTDVQRARFLTPLMSGDEIWCQGFSEPGSGSDVAAAQTTAVLASDGTWVINGSKVWSSWAHVADHCALLARTEPEATKHQGLSFLLVDMTLPGVQVRPLRQLTGDAEFNEIYFDDVRIPASSMLGGRGDGWTVATTALMHERGTSTFAHTAQLEIALKDVVGIAVARGQAHDPFVQRRIADFWIDLQALRVTNNRALAAGSGTPGPEGSISKLFWSWKNQELTEFAQELLGADALLEGADAPYDGAWEYARLRTRGNTIGGGTSEILKNIIAERVLGLPKSR